jgi:hypothetical protein
LKNIENKDLKKNSLQTSATSPSMLKCQRPFPFFSPADTHGPCFFFPLNAETQNQMSITGKQIFQNKDPFLNIELSSTMSNIHLRT